MINKSKSRIMNYTTIYITKQKSFSDYEYKDTLSIENEKQRFRMGWCGQRKGLRDRFVGIGTGVFYREKLNTPFRWLGRIHKMTKVIEGDPSIDKPSQYNLTIPYDDDSWKLFPSNLQGSGHFKKAAQLGMKYSVAQNQFHGIIKHDKL